MNTIKLDSKSAAALARRILKVSFPGVKFSVRHSVHAGGSSVDIRYTDGPAYNLVDSNMKQLTGVGFDSMTDCKTFDSKTFQFEGQTYEVSHSWISVHRTISEEARNKFIDGLNLAENHGMRDLDGYVYREMRKMSL
jgi:hypothetical protein